MNERATNQLPGWRYLAHFQKLPIAPQADDGRVKKALQPGNVLFDIRGRVQTSDVENADLNRSLVID